MIKSLIVYNMGQIMTNFMTISIHVAFAAWCNFPLPPDLWSVPEGGQLGDERRKGAQESWG